MQIREWYKKVKGYVREEVWRVESFGGHNHYHRSTAAYFDVLRGAGMCVTKLLEPAHKGSGDVIPSDFLSQFPLYLMVEARRTT